MKNRMLKFSKQMHFSTLSVNLDKIYLINVDTKWRSELYQCNHNLWLRELILPARMSEMGQFVGGDISLKSG